MTRYPIFVLCPFNVPSSILLIKVWREGIGMITRVSRNIFSMCARRKQGSCEKPKSKLFLIWGNSPLLPVIGGWLNATGGGVTFRRIQEGIVRSNLKDYSGEMPCNIPPPQRHAQSEQECAASDLFNGIKALLYLALYAQR